MSFPADKDAVENDEKDAVENDESSQWISFESEQIRRLHDTVIAAAESLKTDSRGVAEAERVLSDQRVADDADGGRAQLADVPEFLIAELPRRPRLPVLQTAPKPTSAADIDEMFGLPMMLKLGAVAGLAVGVALTVVPRGSIGFGAPSETKAKSQVFSMSALSGLAEISSAQAKIQPDAPASSQSSPVIAAAQPSPPDGAEASAAPQTPATVAALAPSVPEVAPEVAPAPSEPAPTAAPAAAPAAAKMPAHAASALAEDEAEALMKRGRNLLAAGDIASARLILARLADNGEAEASLLLAGTFDPAELARLHVIGVTPDIAQARAWYAKAAEQGSAEGRRRLQQTAAR
jgi:hypothetical protein